MKNRTQGIIIGIIIGILISGTAVMAASYQAQTASFPIYINNQKFEPEKPIMAIDGSTYLALKDIGKALGVDVSWNTQLFRVEIGNTPLPTSTAYSRTNPAPIGTAQRIEIKDFIYDYTAIIKVVDAVRGEAAWTMVKEANMFNEAAPDGFEYIVAKILIHIERVAEDKAVSVSGYNFSPYSSSNVAYDRGVSVVDPKPNLSSSVFAGGSTEGYVTFCVKKDDSDPKIAYGLGYDGSGGIWFSLK